MWHLSASPECVTQLKGMTCLYVEWIDISARHGAFRPAFWWELPLWKVLNWPGELVNWGWAALRAVGSDFGKSLVSRVGGSAAGMCCWNQQTWFALFPFQLINTFEVLMWKRLGSLRPGGELIPFTHSEGVASREITMENFAKHNGVNLELLWELFSISWIMMGRRWLFCCLCHPFELESGKRKSC